MVNRREQNYRNRRDMLAAADKMTVAGHELTRLAGQLIAACDKLFACPDCQPVVTVPVTKAGELVPNAAYATHELTCQSIR